MHSYPIFYLCLSAISSALFAWDNSSAVRGVIVTWEHHPGKVLAGFLFSMAMALLSLGLKPFDLVSYNWINHFVFFVIYMSVSLYWADKHDKESHPSYRGDKWFKYAVPFYMQTFVVLVFLLVELLFLTCFKWVTRINFT